MTVAEDDQIRRLRAQRSNDVGARLMRPRQNVRQEHAKRTQPRADDVFPRRVIVVAVDGSDRRELPQRLEDVRPADVPRMEDVIDGRKEIRDCRRKRSVRVRDDSDAHGI